MLVRFRYLKRIRNRLAAGRLPLSDAILSALKLSRGAVPESSLLPLNRELLGYLPEESQDIFSRFNEAGAIATAVDEDAPLHRLLMGSWVPLSASSSLEQPLPAKDYLFYGEGICELESLLQRVSISRQTWISVATDPERNQVFMCTTSALQKIYDQAKSVLCQYLERLAHEVLTASFHDRAVEARLILLLTRRSK
jgi:hypothetical protein